MSFRAPFLQILPQALLFSALSGCQSGGSGGDATSLSLTASSPPSSNPSAAQLSLSPSSAVARMGSQLQFVPSGGTPPYQFQVIGNGSITAAGLYTAPSFLTGEQVRVEDALGERFSVVINVVNAGPQTPNDPLFSRQWGLQAAAIDAPGAWGVQTDCRSAPIAVLDTGIDELHPELSASIDPRGFNFVANNSSPHDDNLHGTHVSGIIAAAANNTAGVTGICWQSTIVPLKFLDAAGSGTVSDAIRAIDYASSLRVKVMNNSWSGVAFSQALKDAIDRAGASGAIFVAAAGNRAYGPGDPGYFAEVADNDALPQYPSSIPSANVVSVASIDDRDALSVFSRYGATSVHIAAPGEQILSTFPTAVTPEMRSLGLTAPYESISGTSMAAPHVSAAIALLWSKQPGLSLAQARARLLDRADVLPSLQGLIQGSRRLNLFKAVDPN